MRYGYEALAQGTLFSVGFTLRNPTPVELGVFFGGLGYFYERPYLGGKRNRGFGRVDLEFRGFEVKGLTRVERDVSDNAALEAATAYLVENADEIKRLVAEL